MLLIAIHPELAELRHLRDTWRRYLHIFSTPSRSSTHPFLYIIEQRSSANNAIGILLYSFAKMHNATLCLKLLAVEITSRFVIVLYAFWTFRIFHFISVSDKRFRHILPYIKCPFPSLALRGPNHHPSRPYFSQNLHYNTKEIPPRHDYDRG